MKMRCLYGHGVFRRHYLNERLYQSPVLNLDQIFDIGLTSETLAIAHAKM